MRCCHQAERRTKEERARAEALALDLKSREIVEAEEKQFQVSVTPHTYGDAVGNTLKLFMYQS